jgi:hypothetical protein
MKLNTIAKYENERFSVTFHNEKFFSTDRGKTWFRDELPRPPSIQIQGILKNLALWMLAKSLCTWEGDL